MLRARFTEMFGIDHPIVQGGMMWVGRAELVAAVANAGALGFITALTQPTPRGLVAALALGADGVNMGTRFMCTQESGIDDAVKAQIVAGCELDTTLIFRSLRNTARVATNAVSAEVVEIERGGGAFDDIRDLVAGARGRKVFENGDVDAGIGTVGLCPARLPHTRCARGGDRAGRADPEVRVMVLTGRGRAFCSGADLVAVGEARGITPTDTMDAANRLVRAIVQVPVPVIARVTGAAAGIGASLVIAADLTYATENSYLLLAFVNIGLMPDGGASALVAASAGRAVAAKMALLGERLPAAEAKAAGLITDVVADDEIDARVDKAAQKIANGPRRALELTKRAVNAAALSSFEDALAREHEGQIELLTSSDFVEGVAAMLGKRKAQFGP